MESRITKLTAASLVIAAAILGVHSFNGTSVKAVEFSEITKAMNEVPWMHMTAWGFPNEVSIGEQWIGFEARIHAGKEPDGTIVFASEKEHKRFSYHPKTNTIRVTYMEAFPLIVTSPATLLESMHKVLEQQGAKTEARIGSYQGRKVQIQDISLSNVGGHGGSQTVRLYLDPASKRLYAAEVKGVDSAGHAVMAGNVTFDYPAAGPQSIYDLGVPRDAPIGGNGPGASISSFLDQYERARAEATTEYIAVMAMREEPSRTGDDTTTIVEVDYKSGRKRRVESHSVFHGTEAAGLRAQYRQQMGDSFESLLAWTRRHYDDSDTCLSIQFYDGQSHASVERDGKGVWGKLEKRYSAGGFDTNWTLSRQGWPPIDRAARMIEDDYARQNGWVCLEVQNQGLVTSSSWVPLPVRFLYYLDPSRDYLCRRYVMEQRRDASWQKDKNWLAGVDPKKVPEDSTAIIDIPQVAQAPNGHWYPQTIIQSTSSLRRDKRPVKETIITEVYIQAAPQFPDGTFDVNRLPGQ